MALDTTDLRLLRVFVTIVESGGFAAAQAKLNLSLSTISSHMTGLELRLGVTLCRRGRGGFSLTAEGQAVYAEVKRLLGTMDHFDARMRSLRDKLHGTLSIGLVDNTISDPRAPLERVFARFVAAAPEVRLNITSGAPDDLLREVVTGTLHVAIASFPRMVLGLAYEDLYAEAQRFYCGKDHPLFGIPDADIDVDMVRRHRIVGRDYWGGRDLKIFAISGAHATVSDMEAEARLILSGGFLGYLPEHYAAAFVAAGRLRSIRPDLFSREQLFQIAHDPNRAENAALDLMRRIVLEELGPRAAPKRTS
ncbi:LysR family transcriptional regulator [Zavarzinia aquatilis]|uniref:LysR family transcriptional regulator n=1 Tax=Zavarzinia aquatilis TaxID=2211142 RepID=A0A317EBU3_9PROT|nr:LysR family transcriptional regulator [Zavarzinia aquatilis]PWR24409.1 LysR family transcriptional regulator [Zavarzinia aquatilis]